MRAGWIVLWLVGALVATSCICREPAPSGSWDFEDDCVDDTCGFRATSGMVSRVPTLVTGEHGMQLSAGATAEREGVEAIRGNLVSATGWCEQTTPVTFAVFLDGTPSTAQLTFGPTWSEVTATFANDALAMSITSVAISNPSTGRCVLDNIIVGGQPNVCEL